MVARHARRRWHQFTVQRLLVLSTAIAAICAGMSSLHMPEWMRAALVVYFVVVVAWVIFRWPTFRDNMRDIRRRRQELADKRTAIIAEAVKHKGGRCHAPTTQPPPESTD